MRANMRNKISEEQFILIRLLRQALKPEATEHDKELSKLSYAQWGKILKLAKKHAVLPLLYETLKREPAFPADLFEHVQSLSRKTVLQNYKLLYLTNYITKMLERASVSLLLLKGAATAKLYPYPELRKSGDIDLLIPKREELLIACAILKKQGYRVKEEQHANHHIVFETAEGIEIELHSMLAEPFDNSNINRHLNELSAEYLNHREKKDILGSSLWVPEDAYHAYYLLVHMLQHFLGSGFGLKLLCDWVVFWNRECGEEVQVKFFQLVKDSELLYFCRCVTELCISLLGLDEARMEFLRVEAAAEADVEEMLLEILEAEEFGKSDRSRMVILRGTAPTDYLREFHHQMQLNYPRYKKYILLWPVLWILTLGKFLYNNRKLRRTSLWSVLKKNLFQKQRKRTCQVL
jgi:hypothetical protein